MRVYTVGHSTRELEEFIKLLKHYKITQLIDVRTMPMSRHTPQFNHDTLDKALVKHYISYRNLKILGGLRPAKKDTVNGAWRNKSFRDYADYMQTEEFAKGIDELLDLVKQRTTAIMCAEAVPWRCHRSMVGDALLVRDVEVVDIYDDHTAKDETLTSFAHVDGTHITYPATEKTSDEAHWKEEGFTP